MRSKDFGKPHYNLRVALIGSASFEATPDNDNDILYLMSLADVARFCDRNIKGYNLVTDEGYMLRKEELESNSRYKGVDIMQHPWNDATLDIVTNETALHRLSHAFEQKIDSKDETLLAKLFYSDGIQQALFTRQGILYLPKMILIVDN